MCTRLLMNIFLLITRGLFCLNEGSGSSAAFRNIPEDLLSKIFVDYLPDQPGNRLISRRIRDQLDERYNELVGERHQGIAVRGLVNLEALIRLKGRTLDRHRHLSVSLDNPVTSCVPIKLVLRLLKHSNYRIDAASSRRLPPPAVSAIFKDARCLEEYNEIAQLVFGYPNFRAMAGFVDPLIVHKFDEIMRRRLEGRNIICYSASYRGR